VCMFMFYEHTKGIQNRTRIVYDEMDIEWAEIVLQKWTLYSHTIWTSTYIFRISHLHAMNVDVLVGYYVGKLLEKRPSTLATPNLLPLENGT
jgi:hypothetical protein